MMLCIQNVCSVITKDGIRSREDVLVVVGESAAHDEIVLEIVRYYICVTRTTLLISEVI